MLKRLLFVLSVILVGLYVVSLRAQSTIAFPGCEGFGCPTRHAYRATSTPEIKYVTNRNDSGAGSLRTALTGANPAIIICEVGGWIDLLSDIPVAAPDKLINMSMCPGDGLGVRNYTIYFSGTGSNNAHDIVLKHAIIAPGQDGGNNGGLGVQALGGNNISNVVFQNNSIMWYEDEGCQTWGTPNIHDITFRFNTCTEGLNNGMSDEGSGGVISTASAGATSINNVSYIGNVFAHNLRRGGVWFWGNTEAAFVNNLYYNVAHSSDGRTHRFNCTTDNDSNGAIINYAFVGERYVRGPNDADGPIAIEYYNPNSSCTMSTSSKIYRSDISTKVFSGSAWTVFHRPNPPATVDPTVGTPPSELDDILSSITTTAGSNVETYLSTRAGARPASHNSHDTRMFTEIAAGTGSIKTGSTFGEGSAGTYPSLTTTCIDHNIADHDGACANGQHQMPSSPHTVSTGGYTELELWVQSYDCEVSGGSNCWAQEERRLRGPRFRGWLEAILPPGILAWLH